MTTYKVIDKQTGIVVRSGLTLDKAIKLCDKLDTQYGAVRYTKQRQE